MFLNEKGVSGGLRRLERGDVPGELNDSLVDRVLRDEAVDGDLLRLSKTMGAIHGLEIVLRV